jgi:hypothetical protein
MKHNPYIDTPTGDAGLVQGQYYVVRIYVASE